MSKSLEALEDMISWMVDEQVNNFKAQLDIIKQDLERLELIEALYNKSLKEMETIKNDDRELYLKFKQLENENEQLKQQRDSLAINNGELCVKACKLEKALDKACEMLNWDCPVGINLIDDLDCENKCWKKYFLNLADVEVLE